MKKTLIVYFSATGTTKAAAQKLAQEFNADLYEITPEQPYTAADLDWRDKKSRSTLEMQDKSSRPAIKGKCENIADYDTVWIGFPVWWYTAPTIVNTFIEAHDLTGKTLNVFATSGGSDVKDSYNDLPLLQSVDHPYTLTHAPEELSKAAEGVVRGVSELLDRI